MLLSENSDNGVLNLTGDEIKQQLNIKHPEARKSPKFNLLPLYTQMVSTINGMHMIVFDEITKDLIQKTTLRGHSHIECSHSLHQNDSKLQTHPPSTLNIKMLNLPKINVYNFRYKIRVGILIKLFFLSHKCINK